MMGLSKDTIAHFQMWWMLYWHAVLAVVVLASSVYVAFRYFRSIWPIFVVILPAVVSVVCLMTFVNNPWVSYRYRLTVTANINGYTISKSQVYEVHNARFYLSLGETRRNNILVFGEAIFLITIKKFFWSQWPGGTAQTHLTQ